MRMGIFSNGTLSEDVKYELPEVGEYNSSSSALIVSESYEGMFEIIESLYNIDREEIELTKDLRKMEESNTDVALIEERVQQYESILESAMSNAIDKMVTWVKAQWAKFMKFIAYIVKFFDGFFASGKAFAEKYEKDLIAIKGDLADYEHPMYDYTNLESGKTPEKIFHTVLGELDKLDIDAAKLKELSSEDAKAKAESMRSKKEDIMSTIRTELVGNGDRSKFMENLNKHFRSGEKTPKPVNIEAVISELKSEKLVKLAQAAKAGCTSYFNPIIKNLETAKTNVSSGKDEQFQGKDHKDIRSSVVSAYQAYISLIGESNTILLTYIRGWESAAKERQIEFTVICKGAFAYAKKKTKKEEPAKKEPAK